MAAYIESSGEIEVFCFPAGPATRVTVPVFESVTMGDRLALVFGANDGATAPYSLKVVSPSGATILDSIVRDLPTGLPQSPLPIEFVVSTKGVYKVEIREMRGRQRGEAKVRIS
jgi:hypothetical protein